MGSGQNETPCGWEADTGQEIARTALALEADFRAALVAKLGSFND